MVVTSGLLVLFLVYSGIWLLAPFASGRTFFGVPVDADFRASMSARDARRNHLILVGAAVLFGVVWIFSRPNQAASIFIPPGAVGLTALASIAWHHRKLRSYRVAPPALVSVELSAEADRLPRFVGLAALPPLLLAATALYLSWHWAEIPARYPVHWGADHQPNGWAERSVRGVYGPLVFGGLWMMWFVAMALATWYGSRRSVLRRPMVKTMLAMEFLFGLIFPAVGLLPLHHARADWFALGAILAVAAAIVYSVMAFMESASKLRAESFADASARKALCFDREDPSILWERTDGLGYGVNLAHPLAWLLVLAPVGLGIFGTKYLL